MQIRYETKKLTMHPTINCLNNGLVVLGLATSHCRKLTKQKLNWQVRWVDQTQYPMIVVASLSAVPQSCRTPLRYLERERTEGRKREKFYICLDVTHTHPARAGSTLKGKRKKKADTRRADGQKQRRGGRGTDGPPEQTYTAKRT